MANNNKNIIVRIQDWIESISGQTFLNYAYSWGAAVVILGALFKLTHIPGANAMLFIGMGTEVLVFFISGFDRPAELKGKNPKPLANVDNENNEPINENVEVSNTGIPNAGGQPIIIGGGIASSPVIIGGNQADTNGTYTPLNEGTSIQEPITINQGGVSPTPIILGGGGGGNIPTHSIAFGNNIAPTGTHITNAPITSDNTPTTNATTIQTETSGQTSDMQAFVDMVNASNAEILSKVLEEARNSCTPGMKEAGEAYVEELKTLTDILTRVAQQAELMTRDSQEMENLNRTLTGINTIYEMQLKSISTQVGTIDQINEQTHKMAQQIEELNAHYKRMIMAMNGNTRTTPFGGANE